MENSDEFLHLFDKRLSRKTPSRILQGKAWLSYNLHTQNLIAGKFSERFIASKDGTPSLIYKWQDRTTPSSTSAEKIAQYIPDSKLLYDLPLWKLLEDRPLKKPTIDKLMAPYWNPKACTLFGQWDFTLDSKLKAANRVDRPWGKFNSDALKQRGDIFGFMAILAVVREAEASGNGESHFILCSDLYRATPAILKLPWLYEHYDLFRSCIEAIHHRLWTSYRLFSADWEVIHKQILDPTFETERDRRRRDPKTDRFIDLEDPIVINLK